MSIVRSIVRLCAIAAIRGQTLAHGQVFDSDNTPLVEALKASSESLPYIVVYTDTHNRINIEGTDVFQSGNELALVLEIAVASGLSDDGTSIVLPHTDAAMELIIDMVEYQAMRALFGDTRNQWGEYLRVMVNDVMRSPSVRGGRAQTGVRYAMRNTTFVLDTILDVPAGVVMPNTHVVNQVLASFAALPDDDDLKAAGNVIEKVLNATSYSQFEQDQAWLGLTKRGIRATGQAPLADHVDGPSINAIQEPPHIVDVDGDPSGLLKVTIDQIDKDNELFEVEPAPP